MNLIYREIISSTVKTVSVKEQNGNFRQFETLHSSLTIYNPEPSDGGLYECIASNVAGTVSKTAELIVEHSPTFKANSMNIWSSWDQRPVKLFCEGKLLQE